MNASVIASQSTTPLPPPDAVFRQWRSEGSTRRSKLATCLRWAAAAGLRVVVLAPREIGDVPRILAEHPGRRLEHEVDSRWTRERRQLHDGTSQTDDPTAWHVLVIDGEERVVGTISLRVFLDSTSPRNAQIVRLAGACGPILREQCELAVSESHEAAVASRRGFAEVCDWAFDSRLGRGRVAITLMRAVAALATAFNNPFCVLAANRVRNEVDLLLRRGAAPLGRVGKFCLPPFIDIRDASWRRILLADSGQFHARSRSEPGVELAVLRQRASLLCRA